MMPLARLPKRRLDSVSAALSMLGEQHTMSAVRALPPSESCSGNSAWGSLELVLPSGMPACQSCSAAALGVLVTRRYHCRFFITTPLATIPSHPA